MRNYANIGIQAADVLIPSNHINYAKWAVVACDQYTSQPEYWQAVSRTVGNAPSTFHLILPEVYLGTEMAESHQAAIDANMRTYLESGVLQTAEGFIYTERRLGDRKRRGLIAALDLDQYSFQKGAKALIRSTEGTILYRLPPRINIRKTALLEIPHILVLIDDPECTVIEPLEDRKDDLRPLYDFDLMQNGGHLEGYLIQDWEIETHIIAALEKLSQSLTPAGLEDISGEAPFLFAVGDGNHSLATAKSIWDEIRGQSAPDHPARFALVEIVNIHDEGIVFEPIHRLLKGLPTDLLGAFNSYFPGTLHLENVRDFSVIKSEVLVQSVDRQIFGILIKGEFWLAELAQPPHTLTAGSVQACLDELMKSQGVAEIDYIHGDEAILKLGASPDNAGVYLPTMHKSQLFEAVAKEGELPRKTFSMGEANEKRFYLECRMIVP